MIQGVFDKRGPGGRKTLLLALTDEELDALKNRRLVKTADGGVPTLDLDILIVADKDHEALAETLSRYISPDTPVTAEPGTKIPASMFRRKN